MDFGRPVALSRDNSDLRLDHVELYVGNVDSTVEWLSAGYGSAAEQPAVTDSPAADHRSVTTGRGAIRTVVTEVLSDTHPARSYVRQHGDGVGDLGFPVTDASAVFDDAIARGAVAVATPRRSGRAGPSTAVIQGSGDVLHTLVEYDETATEPAPPVSAPGLGRVDHLAGCPEPGELAATREFHESVPGLAMIFEERVVVGDQAMVSKVVRSPSREVTDALADRLDLAAHSVEELRERTILVYEDHEGGLRHIFARSAHPRNTLSFEVIERLGARTFGSGDIEALYESVEAARVRGGALT